MLAAAVLVASFVAANPAAAIDIRIHLVDDPDTAADNYGPDPTGGQLVSVFNVAAQIWEDYLPEEGTYDVDVSWGCDLFGQDVCDTSPYPLGEWSFQFGGNNNIGISASPIVWYFDADGNHDEFDFEQTLYRDLDAGSRNFWFNGSPPPLWEVNYSGGTNRPELEDKFDLLTVALHLLGHELGVNDSGGPWEADPAFLPSGGAEIEESCCGGTVAGHFRAGVGLMRHQEGFGGLSAGRRVLPSAMDIMAVADDEGFDVIDLPRRNYVGTGSWHSGSRWFGGMPPGSDDDAYLRAGASVSLTANATAENLFLSEGAQLTTQNRTLSIGNLTSLVGNFQTFPRPTLRVPTGGTLETYDLTLQHGHLILEGGSVVVDVKADLRIGGRIEGRGTVSAATLENAGLIRAVGGLLELKDLVTANFGGATGGGVLNAQEGNLKLTALLVPDFEGVAQVGPGHYIESTFPWKLGVGGEIALTGEGISGGVIRGHTLTAKGTIHVSGFGVIESPVSFASTANVEVPILSFLWLTRETTFAGGSYTGGGTIAQHGDATIAANTTIAVQSYDMDGLESRPSTITIQPNRRFTVDTRSIEVESEGGYDGVVHVNGGTLDVTTHIFIGSPGGQSFRLPRAWRMEGTLNLNRQSGFDPRVSGSPMIVGFDVPSGGIFSPALVNVNSGTAHVTAPVTFRDSARVSVANGAVLSLESSAATRYEGGTFVGGGTVRQSTNAVVDGTVNFSNTTFDMDGAADNASITIEPGGRLVVDTIGIDPGNDFDGSLSIQGGMADIRPHQFLSGGGQSIRINRPWRMEGLLELRRDGTRATVIGNRMIVGQPDTARPPARILVGPGQALLDTEVQIEPRSVIEFEINGAAAGQFGQLLVDEIELGGTLAATLAGFVPSPSQAFTVMSADVLSGALGNAASGQRLATSDGSGSFLVHYGAGSPFDPTQIVLSDFQPGGLGGGPIQAVHLFYNGSAFDGNGSGVSSASDSAAIALDKTPLLPGGTASFANISGYSRGINGIFVDASGLPNDGAGIDASDFTFRVGNSDDANTWASGPAPTSVDVLPGAGAGGADRIFVTFADGAVRNTWLRMTVEANADTGLAADADFFFGSAVGETGAGFLPGVVGVDAADLQLVAQELTPLAQSSTELITQSADLNRDRTVNAFDFQVVAANLDPNAIQLITPQVSAAGSGAAVPEPASLLLVGLVLLATSPTPCRTLCAQSRRELTRAARPRGRRASRPYGRAAGRSRSKTARGCRCPT